jgi:hypothetical protein
MPPRPRIDPLYIACVRQMARRGVTAAEIVRRLHEVSLATHTPVPSYSAVLRIAAGVPKSDRTASSNPSIEEIVTKLLTGRFPDLYRASLLLALQEGGAEEISRASRDAR